MFKLKRFLKRYKMQTVIAPLFKFLETLFELLIPIIVAKIIDNGIAAMDFSYVLKMSAVMLLFAVVGFTCALVAQYFAAVAAIGYGGEIRSALYKKINRLSFKTIDGVGTSTLVTRLTYDVNASQDGINRFLRLFLRAPFIVIGAIVASIIINPKIGLIITAATIVLGLTVFIIMKLAVPKNRAAASELDSVTLLTKESIDGARVIKAFNEQEKQDKKLTSAQKRLVKFQLIAGRITALLNPLSFAFANLAIILVLWLGGKYVFGGNMLSGSVVALVNYMTQVLAALTALTDLIIIMAAATASNARIDEVFNFPEEKNAGSVLNGKETDIKVEFKNVYFKYTDSGEYLLNDISFTANKGEVIGIIGGTGSGKSTLINLMPAFYNVNRGQILVDGVPVNDYDLNALRSKFGIVPQKAVLFKGTLLENLKWGNENASFKDIESALEISQAKEFVDLFEDGLNKKIEQGGRNLSGGQRQRLTIARALIKKPEILILDDSSSALDYGTEKALRKGLASLKGVTQFIITQRAASVINADKIIVIEDGKIVGIGKHKDLYTDCLEYKEICDTQFKNTEAGL